MEKKLTLSLIGLVVILSSVLLLILKPFNIVTNNEPKDASMLRDVVDEDEGKLKIVVDIGHGGKDNGTTNKGFAERVVYEKDVNLEIGLKLIKELSKEDDIKVITTRTDDTFVELADRVEVSNKNNADIFISVHCNATADGDNRVRGLETYYYNSSDSSVELANSVHKNILEANSKKDRGVKKGDYQVLRDSKIPAILIECGFLTNPLELEQLTDEMYQDIMVNAIVKGIKEYKLTLEDTVITDADILNIEE